MNSILFVQLVQFYTRVQQGTFGGRPSMLLEGDAKPPAPRRQSDPADRTSQVHRRMLTAVNPLDRPIVIYADGAVLDADPRAVSRGVRVGMRLSEARSILCGEGRFLPYQAAEYAEARQMWLDCCVEFSDRIEPETASSAFIDLEGHADVFTAVDELLQRLHQRFGLPIVAGFAGSKWLAKLAARPCDPNDLQWGLRAFEPVIDPDALLSQTPIESLALIPIETRRRLEFMGYRRIGDVKSAPKSTLLQYFGQDGLVIYEAVRGRASDRVMPVYPPDALSCRRSFDGGITDLLVVQQTIQELAYELSHLLCTKDKQGNELLLVFERESGGPLAVKRTSPKAMQRAETILAALNAMSAPLKIESPILAIRCSMPRLQRSASHQLSLSQVASPRERQIAAETALHVLRTTLHDRAPQVASSMARPRRKSVLQAWNHVIRFE